MGRVFWQNKSPVCHTQVIMSTIKVFDKYKLFNTNIRAQFLKPYITDF